MNVRNVWNSYHKLHVEEKNKIVFTIKQRYNIFMRYPVTVCHTSKRIGPIQDTDEDEDEDEDDDDDKNKNDTRLRKIHVPNCYHPLRSYPNI
jgi:hypothetical protein